MNRRFFLRSGSIALASVGMSLSAPSFLERVVMGREASAAGGRRKVLIAIFQRGAVDGLNMVVPFGESNYYNARPSIAIPKPESGNVESAIDLDGFFGLHPSMRSFKPLWDSQRLAIVHASGSPDNSRSHFDAQDYMESATPGVKSTADGWLNRYLQAKKDSKASSFRAVSMTRTMPRVLMGRSPSIAMANLNEFSIRAGKASANVQSGFEEIYAKQNRDASTKTGRATFDAVNYLKQADPAKYKPENGAEYPNGPFANHPREMRQLIRRKLGVEIPLPAGGEWDPPATRANVRGNPPTLLTSSVWESRRSIRTWV